MFVWFCDIKARLSVICINQEGERRMSEVIKGQPLKPILTGYFESRGFTELDVVRLWAKKGTRSLLLAEALPARIDRAVCEEFRELSQDDADDYRIHLPAVEFRLQNSDTQWLVSVEHVMINGDKQRALRFTTVQFQREQGVISPMWTEDRRDDPRFEHRGSPYPYL